MGKIHDKLMKEVKELSHSTFDMLKKLGVNEEEIALKKKEFIDRETALENERIQEQKEYERRHRIKKVCEMWATIILFILAITVILTTIFLIENKVIMAMILIGDTILSFWGHKYLTYLNIWIFLKTRKGVQ